MCISPLALIIDQVWYFTSNKKL